MSYEDDVKDITGAFGGAVDDIKRELEQMPLDRRGANAATKKIGGILKSLTGKASSWVDRVIPKAAKNGVSRALNALGLGKKNEEPPVNRANSELISSTSEDTYADLLAVTQNIDRRTKAAIRRAVADAMRANMAAGINGRRTINADTIANIRKELGAAADNAIVDAAGRRWKVETYVDMVTRTRAMKTQIDATINESLARGVRYGVISKHGAKDACGRWEGRIVKLVRDADGPYPFIGDLPRREIFHPNCRHVISPVRNPGIEDTGGRTNYKPSDPKRVAEYDRLDKIATQLHEEIANSDDKDVDSIANHVNWDRKDIQQVKEHVFRKRHTREDGRFERFHPDYEITQAWQRLTKGIHYDVDLLLLNHELYESNYMIKHNAHYEEGHKEANKLYDWNLRIEELKAAARRS
ncbi:phage minor capsid protein [Paenibacillus sp. YIM B09110]|uniref:phage minor capsid protein n=1 Tax=Paenibacillus sp. YIM B09110 TaxID=3126102 RepID=UPI00301DDC2A